MQLTRVVVVNVFVSHQISATLSGASPTKPVVLFSE